MDARSKLNSALTHIRFSLSFLLVLLGVLSLFTLDKVFTLMQNNRVILIAEMPEKCEAIIKDNSFFAEQRTRIVEPTDGIINPPQ